MVWLIRLHFIILFFLAFSRIINADDLSSEEKMLFNFVDLDNDNKLSSSPSQRNRSKHRSTIDYQFSRSNRLSPKNSKSPKSLANAVVSIYIY